VALVRERVATGMDGACWIDITYNDTGQLLADHFDVHNEASEPVRVTLRRTGVVLYQDWFGGGPEKNSHNPSVDTIVAAPPSLSWRRTAKQTDWAIGFAYPSYPPPV
jgi:hypothetical protein